jgi:hypothetical protein
VYNKYCCVVVFYVIFVFGSFCYGISLMYGTRTDNKGNMDVINQPVVMVI